MLISRSSAVSVSGLERVDTVAPRLLLGFALCKGSKLRGAEQGAEQQSMGTCMRVEAHGGCDADAVETYLRQISDLGGGLFSGGDHHDDYPDRKEDH